MNFQFVEHGAVTQRKRRAMRSHVMKGKNAGKILPSRGQQHKSVSKPQNIATHENMIMSLRRMVGNNLSSYSPGTDLTPYTRLVLNQCRFTLLYTMNSFEAF